jgi:hypothetical protein
VLTEAEAGSYIEHRLEVAGSHGRQIIDPASYPLIYRYTGGVPRLINTLCDTAMMAAFTANRDFVTTDDVIDALRELQWTEFASRTGRIYAPGMTQQLPVTAPAPAEPAMPLARIFVAHEGETFLERELRPGRVVIGRTAENDIQIDSAFVSRHHCQIVTRADTCMIEDLNSTNGIYVQSRRVRKYNLNDGDVVQIGKHEIMYIDERVQQQRGGSAHGDHRKRDAESLGDRDDGEGDGD